VWNRDSGKGIEVGWLWCTMPRHLGGLGILNISAKGLALASKWMVKAITLEEFWARYYRDIIGKPEFKEFKGWSNGNIEEKLLAKWDIEVKGPIFFKRMWIAWRAVKELIDKGENRIGKESSMWLHPISGSESLWIFEEGNLVRMVKGRGLERWDQLIDLNLGKVKNSKDVLKEFGLKRRAKELVEDRIYTLKEFGVERC